MAAINLHIGTQAVSDRSTELTCAIDNVPVGDFDAARRCVPSISQTHNGLTRMVWLRRALEDILARRSYYVADGASLGVDDRAKLYFVIEPPFARHEIPWMPAATEELSITGLVGQAGKMACPTWDLPAGAPLAGGSCPGAVPGQSIVPLPIRRKVEAAAANQGIDLGPSGLRSDGVDLQTTICAICYAEGGQYASPHVQIGELVRYWWCRELLDRGEAGQKELVDTIVRAIEGEIFPVERMIDPRTGNPVLPMRVHSSGDFFSPAYARAWIDIANRLPEVSFWAPTRTWAAPSWVEHWRRLVPMLAHGNLSLRPSAYHTGDIAPGAGHHPWAVDYPFTAAGTTAIYKFDDAGAERGVSRDPRYDWACQTYSILDDAHSCQNALAPDGQIGCRVCWVHRELRVNYTAH